jgi:hypothetical protein
MSYIRYEQKNKRPEKMVKKNIIYNAVIEPKKKKKQFSFTVYGQLQV